MRNTNVDGLVHVTRAVVDGMKQRKFGRIVNLTSVAAFAPRWPALRSTLRQSRRFPAHRRFAMDLGPHASR